MSAVLDAPQGSEAWKLQRCGSIGASDAPKVVRRTKSGYSADRDSLMAAKVLERLTGVPVEVFKTQAMLQGTAREPDARMLYALVKGVEVEETGLVPHPSIVGSHASPDGTIGADGLIEIKAPMPAAHLDMLLNQTISNDHVVQVMWQMACTGRRYCDYVSFSSDFPPAMQLFVRRVPRDTQLIQELEGEVRKFLVELEAKVEALKRRYREAA
jgi:predicted phage-related endonuclease